MSSVWYASLSSSHLVQAYLDFKIELEFFNSLPLHWLSVRFKDQSLHSLLRDHFSSEKGLVNHMVLVHISGGKVWLKYLSSWFILLCWLSWHTTLWVWMILIFRYSLFWILSWSALNSMEVPMDYAFLCWSQN